MIRLSGSQGSRHSALTKRRIEFTIYRAEMISVQTDGIKATISGLDSLTFEHAAIELDRQWQSE